MSRGLGCGLALRARTGFGASRGGFGGEIGEGVLLTLGQIGPDGRARTGAGGGGAGSSSGTLRISGGTSA